MAPYKLSNNLIKDCTQLHSEVDAIERRLKTPLPSPKYNQLFHKLEVIHCAIQQIKTNTDQIDDLAKAQISHLGTLEEKVQSLFGDIYTLSINNKVSIITEKAFHLENSIGNASSSQISKEMRSLKTRINTLCKKNRLSLGNQKKVAAAEQSIQKADHFIHGKILGNTLNQFNVLSLQQTKESSEIEEIAEVEQAELVMDLFEIFDLYSQSKFSLAKTQFRQLPTSIKSRIERYAEEISKETNDENLIFLKSILTLANEILDNGKGTPSDQEICEMIEEIDQIRKRSKNLSQ